MTNKKRLYTIGIAVIALGIAMFLFGASMFSYQGSNITPFESELGMYSFLFWLPVIVIGIIVVIVGRFVKK